MLSLFHIVPAGTVINIPIVVLSINLSILRIDMANPSLLESYSVPEVYDNDDLGRSVHKYGVETL
jgi:hypothetical protein